MFHEQIKCTLNIKYNCFFPTTYVDPTMTAAERSSLIMTDLLTVLKTLPTPFPIFNSQQELATAKSTLQSTLGRDTLPPQYHHHHHNQSVHQAFPSSPTPTFTPIFDQHVRKSINLYPIGTIIRNYCLDISSFIESEVTSYNAINNLYHFKYIQGDREGFTYDEIHKHRKTTQKYTKKQ